MKVYTGIGSQETPGHICYAETKIAEVLYELGYTLRSGAARGSDTAFELGAGEEKEIYLPWKGFANSKSELYLKNLEKVDVAYDIARRLYQNHFHSSASQKLHTRNVYQVLGKQLDDPSEFVICYTEANPDKRRGGTCLGMNLAFELGIPVYNLASTLEMRELEIQLDVDLMEVVYG